MSRVVFIRNRRAPAGWCDTKSLVSSGLVDFHRDADALVLVTNDRSIVGSLGIGWDGWRCHLYRLAMHPDYRRRGIGSSLLKRAEERFVAFGGIRADAMVLDGNDSAHELWSWAGYTQQGEWSRWVKTLI